MYKQVRFRDIQSRILPKAISTAQMISLFLMIWSFYRAPPSILQVRLHCVFVCWEGSPMQKKFHSVNTKGNSAIYRYLWTTGKLQDENLKSRKSKEFITGECCLTFSVASDRLNFAVFAAWFPSRCLILRNRKALECTEGTHGTLTELPQQTVGNKFLVTNCWH